MTVLKVLTVPRVLIVLLLAVLSVPVVHAQKSAVIAGQVVDGVTGKPIAAAIVALSGPRLLGTAQPPKVLTDADGRFVFGSLDAGLYTVTASKGGYAERDAGGAARGGVTIVVFSADRSRWFFGSRRLAAVETAEDGRYVIRNLPPGEYRVVATTDLEDYQWFHPDVLERLLPHSTAVAIADAGTSKVDLTIR